MKLTVLGSGDAFGSGGRCNTSFLLTHGEEHVLLDCGASTLIQLKKAAVSLEKISTIILSHFHGDHFGGIPFFLIASMFEQPRQGKLTIIGPKGVKEKVYALQAIMYPSTVERLEQLDLDFLTFEEGKLLHHDDKIIEAFEMEHSPASKPHGFRLKWKQKIVAFSGDTSMTDKLLKLADNADLFICECNFLKAVDFGHLSYEEIFNIKDELHCKQLWLTHMNEEVYNAKGVALNKLNDGLKLYF